MAIAVLLGILEKNEGSLIDSNTARLLEFGIRNPGVIDIRQGREGEPLEGVVSSYEQVKNGHGADLSNREEIIFDEKQWERVKHVVEQFTAAANWGLGDPFDYKVTSDGVRHVMAFTREDFEYKNPFTPSRSPRQDPPMVYSSFKVDSRRDGWRVIGRGLVLLVSNSAKKREVVLSANVLAHGGGAFAAQDFLLKNGDGTGLWLSAGPLPGAQNKRQTLALRRVSSDGQISQQAPKELRAGDYFVWNGIPFAVFEIRGASQGADIGNLIFTKRVNGRPTRVHVLGEATTNLLGARIGSFTPYLEGALKHDKVRRLTLTLDPELQCGTYALLRHALLQIEGRAKRNRDRKGSVSILSAETGQILAQVGYPSFNPNWAERRRVLIDRASLRKSPSRDANKPGSAIKVFSVAAGYLLTGEARAELLPLSNNSLAVQQAFQNAYGVALDAPLKGAEADITPVAHWRFQEVGGPSKVRREFVNLMEQVFLLAPSLSRRAPGNPEEIVSPNLRAFFDEDILRTQVYPAPSHFPILDAGTMDEVRFCALGLANTRLTPLRLASILTTASTGKVVRPYLVESVATRDSDGVIPAQPSGLSEIELPWQELRERCDAMIQGTTTQLKKVLLPGGTGSFWTDKGTGQYLGHDDPDTPEINERNSRERDFGKSGTADYGPAEPFQDSVFVYRHGLYVIAVWLEYADRGKPTRQGDLPYLRHPAHKLTHHIVQLIESLELPQ